MITTSAVLNGQINCRPPKAALWLWQHSRPNCTTLGFQPGEQRCSLPLSCLCFIIFSGGASDETGWRKIKQGEQRGWRWQWIRNFSQVRGGDGVLVLDKLYFQIILLSTLRSKPSLNERCEPIKPFSSQLSRLRSSDNFFRISFALLSILSCCIKLCSRIVVAL